MASRSGMASSKAAAKMLQQLEGGGGMPMGPEMMPPEEMPLEGAPAMPEAGGGDPSALLDELTAAFEGAPQDVANQARSHLNALRELLAQGQAEAPQEPPVEGAPTGAPMADIGKQEV